MTNTLQTHRRDYFQLRAPRHDVMRVMKLRNACPRAHSALILDLQKEFDPEVEVDSRPVPVVPYPAAARDLVALVTEPMEDAEAESGEIELFLPREPFDKVTDDQGADRIEGLSLSAGGAVEDTTLSDLGACLDHASQPTNAVVVDHIRQALTVHLAQTYGGMQPAKARACGGLAPWQLRLARNTFDEHLDGSFSLKAVAAECGLSLSHFSRAFARSAGMPPHRWLVQRRIEVAKEMMEDPRTSLAEVALACGFSDQSHFTRAFGRACGATPGAWRREHCVQALPRPAELSSGALAASR